MTAVPKRRNTSGTTKGARDTGKRQGAKGATRSATQPNDRQQDVHAADKRAHATGAEGLALHEVPRLPPEMTGKADKLQAPPPRPGQSQRWIRVLLGSGKDTKNLSDAQRDGWRPRLASTVGPEHTPSTTIINGYEYIGEGDLVLMERPVEYDRREAALEAREIARRTGAVERALERAQQPGGPSIQVGQKTSVTRGKRRPQVQRGAAADDLADSEISGGQEFAARDELDLDAD